MNKIILSLVLMFILVSSGCVTGSKAVKPSSIKVGNPAPKIIEKNNISESPMVVSNNPIKPAIQGVSEDIKTYPISKPVQEPVKIQYSQITDLISEFIDMKESNHVPGENKYFGVSENKLTIFEIKGNKDDIKEASMKLLYPKGIDEISAKLNNAMMLRFLRNAAPEYQNWHSYIKDILNKFYSMEVGSHGVSQEDMILSNKIINILCDRNADIIIVTLKTHP